MDYFQMKQDKRYVHTPVISNLSDIVQRRGAMCLKNASEIPDINVAFASSEQKLDYIDVLDQQLFMVNNEIKKVFCMYEPAMIFKTICVLNNRDGSYCNYNAPLFKEIDCLPDEFKLVQNRKRAKSLFLIEEAVKESSIFKIADVAEDIVMIRLDVAESLFRRGLRRFMLERVVLI